MLAYPSLDEGFGFPLLDAMLGTPVVASTAGSIPEVAGEAALLSPADDVEALAANLYWTCHRRDVRQARPARAHQRHRFSWADTARQLTATYDELAGGLAVTG